MKKKTTLHWVSFYNELRNRKQLIDTLRKDAFSFTYTCIVKNGVFQNNSKLTC